MTGEEILGLFYDSFEFKKGKHGWNSKLDLNFYKGKVLNYNILDFNSGKLILEKGTKVTQRHIDDVLKKKRSIFCIEEDNTDKLLLKNSKVPS